MKPTGPWKRAQTCARAALAIAVLASPAADAACQLVRLAELQTAGERPLIPVSLDGQPAQMLIDTGSFASFMWRSAAEALHLDQTSSDVRAGYGVGGRTTSGLVEIRQFGLGEYTAHNVILNTLGERGSPLKANPWSPAVGMLGEDFLYRMDEEFDFASGKIRLFDPKGCHGDQVVYWASAYNMLTLNPVGEYHAPVATVLLNGHELVALFDTGAGPSVLQADVATRPGLSPEAQTGNAAVLQGTGPAPVAASTARFASLAIGQETIRNPTLRVADMDAATREQILGSHIRRNVLPFDLVLGMDFFRAHRVYLARSQGKMYFTYTGGPLFQPPQPPATPAQAGTPPPPQASSTAPREN